MAFHPVPPDLAEPQPLFQLVVRIAARHPHTCDAKTGGGPWGPTLEVVPRLLGWPMDAEAWVIAHSEHAGIYYFTLKTEQSGKPWSEQGGFASTSRRILPGGVLSPVATCEIAAATTQAPKRAGLT
jgi:hypothetical protein